MKTYHVLSRDYGTRGARQFSVSTVKAIDDDSAWQEVEETIASNNSQDWLMDAKEWQAFKKFMLTIWTR